MRQDRPGFTPLGIWAFSIGTSIGWGSFIVTCNSYLSKAGILGTTFGLLTGMAVILVITWNLQYMIQTAPDAGGIYTFEKKIGGKDLGFLAFWFVLLTYMAILWANITSVPLFARFFMGSTYQTGFHYSIFGYEVWFGEAVLSVAVVLLIGILCVFSRKLPNIAVTAAALIFSIGFTVCAVIAVMRHDPALSYDPMYTDGSDAFAQIVRIAAISPWAFIGFENVAHFSEEYEFPVKKIRGILISSVVITTLLYLFVSMLSVSAYPPEYDTWLDYILDMGNLEGIKAVPAFYAANYYLGRTGVVVLMFALFGVILTSLIGNTLALSRLLYAAGREGEAPKRLSSLNGKGIPANAVYAIVAASVFIPFLGRTAIGWIVDVTTLGATLIYGLISHAVYLHAKESGRRAEQYTGMAGMLLMLCFILLLLIPGLLPFHAMETESYALFIVWSVLGLVYFRGLMRRDSSREYGQQRVIVWIILLVLVMFASMMWVSRATENAANTAVDNIFEYHETHPDDDSDETVREERVEFLQEQAKNIAGTNTLYTIVSLGLFILFISMMMNNYRDTQKLDKRLSEAEKEAETAGRIAELNNTISSLLDNIPGMTLTKDAETGVYLACNQAFADYARRPGPNDVIGHTDAQLFDAETAKRFTDDDRIALSMDEPYVYFEEETDENGRTRQLQTTKLKYVDASGRLCLLVLSRDITDMIRIQHEEAMTAEDFEKYRGAGIMYAHIAQTLARDYKDMFYVNLDTEEFIEYRRDDGGALAEMTRGWHFFSDCRAELSQSVYTEDRDAFLKATDRRTLMKALEQKDTFAMSFRQTGNTEPVYVSMKISIMEDDRNFIVVGITDVDAEMRNAMTKSEALSEALTSAEEASKAKTSFLSSMSHEIRTPMNAIIGLDTLALQSDDLSDQTRDYLEKIGGSARHLLGLINDILDMSRIESGRLTLQKEVFSPAVMLEQINTMIMSQCRDKGLTYECRILNQIDRSYIGDDMKLKEILINLLSNAVKYTEAPGSITLTLERTAKYEEQSVLRFCIRDTGIGMDEEFIPKLFDAFSQENDSFSTGYNSTGLGMAITKKIVEMMNGSISVESEKGVGTEFTVTVTLRNCDQSGAGADREIDPHDLYVLVVDDDTIAAEHAEAVLEEVGIKADICRGGEDALRMMEIQHTKHRPYNLVLMDWDMPEMNGGDTAAEIRKRYGNESTIVILTAHSWDDIQEGARRAGIENFLTKPLFAASVMDEFERIARRSNMTLIKDKARADMTGRRVLLAEDMEINAEIITDLLEMENIEVDHAENGKIASEMFEDSAEGTYAVILMDVRMPVMDGLEATAVIRAMDRDDAKRIPIIALTANAFDEDVQRSMQAGMNAHLTKPIEPDQLVKVMSELVYEAGQAEYRA